MLRYVFLRFSRLRICISSSLWYRVARYVHVCGHQHFEGTYRRHLQDVHFLQMEAIYAYVMLLTAYNMTGSHGLENCNIRQ